MYKHFAEILEKSTDLDFACNIVQNLNLILVTAPEVAQKRASN